MKLLLCPLYLVLFVYWAISAHCAGMAGFWNLFWTGYVEMTLVSLGDFIILDCWLPGKVRHMIKGAAGLPDGRVDRGGNRGTDSIVKLYI